MASAMPRVTPIWWVPTPSTSRQVLRSTTSRYKAAKASPIVRTCPSPSRQKSTLPITNWYGTSVMALRAPTTLSFTLLVNPVPITSRSSSPPKKAAAPARRATPLNSSWTPHSNTSSSTTRSARVSYTQATDSTTSALKTTPYWHGYKATPSTANAKTRCSSTSTPTSNTTSPSTTAVAGKVSPACMTPTDSVSSTPSLAPTTVSSTC